MWDFLNGGSSLIFCEDGIIGTNLELKLCLCVFLKIFFLVGTFE